MVRVNSFLGCCQLDTFGKFVACFELIAAFVAAGFGAFAIRHGFKQKDGSGILPIKLGSGACGMALIAIPICILMLWAIYKRCPRKVVIFRHFCFFTLAATIFCTLYCILKLTVPPPETDYDYYDDVSTIAPTTVPKSSRRLPYKHIISAFGVCIIYRVFVIVCVHSLHKKFEEEKLSAIRTGPMSVFA